MATAADPPSVRRVGPWRLTRAPAKVNLGLRVIGRRTDGYHLLDSLVAFAGLADHLAVRPASGAPSLCIRGPFGAPLAATAAEENLAWRAAEGFRRAFGGPAVDVLLWKRLPTAAGIGGGTADAAAVLRLLADMAGVATDDPALVQAALDLGADGPMCLAGRTARIGGVGERIEAAPRLPRLPVVLVNPGVPVATPAVFRRREGPFSDNGDLGEGYSNPQALAGALKAFGNDLLAPALALEPVIGEALSALTESANCLFAGMSGSGATCFGLFPNDVAARAAANGLAVLAPRWWIAATELNASEG